ncbi:MAG: hypothetical protein FWG98_06720 [Candidatus Cloacimonetes bacterium]|nr:hypothetical protein [Candidatus Cloacimonadota bacterium]
MKNFNFTKNKSVYQTSIYNLLKNKTPITVSSDTCGTFHNPIWSTVKRKEQLGIEDTNLIFKGDSFPLDAKIGQVFLKDGIMYEFDGETINDADILAKEGGDYEE